MAGKQRSIFIRFNMADEADCDLYMKLTEAVEGSTPLTAYVKRALLAEIGIVNMPTIRDEAIAKETELPEVCGIFRMNSVVCLILSANEVKESGMENIEEII